MKSILIKAITLVLLFVVMFAIIAGATYIIIKYVNSDFGLWLYLAFVVLPPIALFIAYKKTNRQLFGYANIFGAFAFIPASFVGCYNVNPEGWDMDPGKSYPTDYSIPFHTAEELHKLTGMEFPQVELVDSMAEEGGAFQGAFRRERGKLLITDTRRAAKNFRKRLEEACKDEESGWHVGPNDSAYHWTACPKGEPNNNGDYNIDVPMKGDTITISTFWQRG